MASGLAFYALTRLIQAALLIGLFVASYGQETRTPKGRGLWWTSLIMSALLGLLQCYTFVIYSAIWRRRIGQHKLPKLPQHRPPTTSQPGSCTASPTPPVPPGKEALASGTQVPHEAHDILSSRAELLPSHMPLEIMDTAMLTPLRSEHA